jgi:hypothetical protein
MHSMSIATVSPIARPDRDQNRQPSRPTGSSRLPKPGNLLQHVAINYGPADLLGRFFLKADDTARQRGVSFSIGTFDELMKLNETYREGWMRMTTMYDPEFCPNDLTPDKAWMIFGRNADGEIVTCSGAKLVDLGPNTTLHTALTNQRVFFENPERDQLPGETWTVSAPIAHSLRGKVFIGGAGWVRPDYRGRDLPGLSVRVSRAMALSKVGLDSYVSFLMDYRVKHGFDLDLGYPRGEWALSGRGTRTGNPNTKVVYLFPDEIIEDLRRSLAELEGEPAAVSMGDRQSA